MKDYLLEAREELKRLEHIIYVSLKYTRTVDVIINALQRLLSTYDWIIEAYLKDAQAKGLFTTYPKSAPLKKKLLEELYPDNKELQKYLVFYTFLKTVLNAKHAKKEEYRRHVALLVEIDHANIEINIDNLSNCEHFVHNFFRYSWEQLIGKLPED